MHGFANAFACVRGACAGVNYLLFTRYHDLQKSLMEGISERASLSTTRTYFRVVRVDLRSRLGGRRASGGGGSASVDHPVAATVAVGVRIAIAITNSVTNSLAISNTIAATIAIAVASTFAATKRED